MKSGCSGGLFRLVVLAGRWTMLRHLATDKNGCSVGLFWLVVLAGRSTKSGRVARDTRAPL